MNKKIFDQIAEGLLEALAVAKGENEPLVVSKKQTKNGNSSVKKQILN